MKFTFFLLTLASITSAQLSFPQLGGGAPTAEIKADTVIASVDGKDITLADIRKMVDADPRLMQFLQQNPQTAISQFFLMRFLAAEGDRKKIADQSPLKDQIETARAIAVAGAVLNLERDSYYVSSELMQNYFDSKRTRRIRALEGARLLSLVISWFQPAQQSEMDSRAP